MTRSLILRTATRILVPLMLLFSVFLLLRGHDAPGGGFVGGLVVAAAYSLHAIAYGPRETRRLLRADPRSLIGAGLLLALASALVGPFAGRPFFTGLWGSVGGLALSTPFVFDVGVYVVVSGVTLTIVLGLAEE